MSPGGGLVPLEDNVVVLGGQGILARLVVKSVVVILAVLRALGLHVLIRHVFPVAQPALHDALD